MELITTTVSLDAQKAADQVVIHLVKGDSGTRRFQFVPIEGGHLVDMYGLNVAQVKMRAYSRTTTDMLVIDCTFNNASRLIYMTPTEALVANVDEWDSQLVLLDGDNQTLSTMPFTIMIHGTVFEGDAVEHTNTSVLNISYDAANRYIVLEMADNTTLTAELPLSSASLAGLMSAAQYSSLATLVTQMATLMDWLDQSVKTTASPTFYAATIGAVGIDHEGVVTGMKFT